MSKFEQIIAERNSKYDNNTEEALKEIVTFLQAMEEHLIESDKFPNTYSILWLVCDVKNGTNDTFVSVAGALYKNEQKDYEKSVVKITKVDENDLSNQVIRVAVPLEVALNKNFEEVKTYLAHVSVHDSLESLIGRDQKEQPVSLDFDTSSLTEDQNKQIGYFRHHMETKN